MKFQNFRSQKWMKGGNSAWNSLNTQTRRRLVFSMRRRCLGVIAADSFWSNYWFSIFHEKTTDVNQESGVLSFLWIQLNVCLYDEFKCVNMLFLWHSFSNWIFENTVCVYKLDDCNMCITEFVYTEIGMNLLGHRSTNSKKTLRFRKSK